MREKGGRVMRMKWFHSQTSGRLTSIVRSENIFLYIRVLGLSLCLSLSVSLCLRLSLSLSLSWGVTTIGAGRVVAPPRFSGINLMLIGGVASVQKFRHFVRVSAPPSKC